MITIGIHAIQTTRKQKNNWGLYPWVLIEYFNLVQKIIIINKGLSTILALTKYVWFQFHPCKIFNFDSTLTLWNEAQCYPSVYSWMENAYIDNGKCICRHHFIHKNATHRKKKKKTTHLHKNLNNVVLGCPKKKSMKHWFCCPEKTKETKNMKHYTHHFFFLTFWDRTVCDFSWS